MSQEIYSQIIDAIQKLGFPIIVALFFMFRTDKKIDKNSDLISALLNKIQKDEDRKDG